MIKLAILFLLLAVLLTLPAIWCGKLARWAVDKMSAKRQPQGP